MKKIVVFLVVLCAFATSAFAAVTISDWGIYERIHTNPIVYDGLITDIAPAGFSVTADPAMWDEGDSPMAAFLSKTVSPGWMLFLDKDTYEVNTFRVKITGFDDLIVKEEGTPFHTNDMIVVNLFSSAYGMMDRMLYQTSWKGDGVYTFGRDELQGSYGSGEMDVAMVYFWTITDAARIADYYLGDNTAGTIEFILPENEVPEPSSLLALAFGGAGTAFAFRKDKQR
ncbi:MAG: PEP-CTERM sorting domain-containing protein [Abditibacteriota bacterium]|nr:PEP-CTERM sorting domain-containing protein [Abditibacteriota bacterium]